MKSGKRKQTVKVEWLKNHVNEKLKLQTITQEQKSSLCVIIERVLMDTGNYKGFLYYNANGEIKFDPEYNKTHEYDRFYF